jgi:hypothetical protein
MEYFNSFFFKKQEQFIKAENRAWSLFFSKIESPFLFTIARAFLVCALTLIAFVFVTSLLDYLLIGIYKSVIITAKFISTFVSKSYWFYHELKKNMKFFFKRNVKRFLRKKGSKGLILFFKNWF